MFAVVVFERPVSKKADVVLTAIARTPRPGPRAEAKVLLPPLLTGSGVGAELERPARRARPGPAKTPGRTTIPPPKGIAPGKPTNVGDLPSPAHLDDLGQITQIAGRLITFPINEAARTPMPGARPQLLPDRRALNALHTKSKDNGRILTKVITAGHPRAVTPSPKTQTTARPPGSTELTPRERKRKRRFLTIVNPASAPPAQVPRVSGT